MQKKSILENKRKQFFKIASLLALIKRKSRQRFLQTLGKTYYNNVTAFFFCILFPWNAVGVAGGRGEGLVNKNGLG